MLLISSVFLQYHSVACNLPKFAGHAAMSTAQPIYDVYKDQELLRVKWKTHLPISKRTNTFVSHMTIRTQHQLRQDGFSLYRTCFGLFLCTPDHVVSLMTVVALPVSSLAYTLHPILLCFKHVRYQTNYFEPCSLHSKRHSDQWLKQQLAGYSRLIRKHFQLNVFTSHTVLLTVCGV